MSIKNVNIKNFTIFDDISIDFASGVNVVIGENGTGKTHLLKIMNILSRPKNETELFLGSVSNYFNAPNKEIISSKSDTATISVLYNEEVIKYDITRTEVKHNLTEAIENYSYNNVFIPAKELLTHSKGFLSLYDERKIPFDKTIKDLISKSMLPELRISPEIGKNILPKIEEIIGGIVIIEDEVFYIQKTNGDKVRFSLEAEGIKKLALIWQLLVTGCIAKGSIVFWDEADSNVNPKLFSDIANILLELSRNGVQIFLTTHDYVLAKYIEVLKNDEDSVMFYSLYKNENGKIECEQDKVYEHIVNNSIRDENVVLYEAELDKVFG